MEFKTAARDINLIEVDAEGNRQPGRSGSYMGTQVQQVTCSASGMETTIVRFCPTGFEDKEPKCILVFMGGPYESRTTYDGFPCALAQATGLVVFSVSYLGSQQLMHGPTDPSLVKNMLNADGEFDHVRIADEIDQVITMGILKQGYEVALTFCHSYGAVAYLTWLAHYEVGPAIDNVVFCEPYWPIHALAPLFAGEAETYGYSPKVMQEGPFKQFGEGALLPKLQALGNSKFKLLLAGGFRNAVSKAIAAQVDTTYAGADTELLPGCNHGMNLKHVNLTNWGGMTREDVENAVALLLSKIAGCL